jgi:hypothetical protein
VAAWSVEDALRCAAAVLTYVQVGTPFELAALQLAGRVAAAADGAGVAYVCEIMPPGDDPLAIAACCRTAAELGARREDLVPAASIFDRRRGRMRYPDRARRWRPRGPADALADAADAMAPEQPASHSAATCGVPVTLRRWCVISSTVHGAAAPAS